MRRQYETLVFAPNRTVEGAYNLWRGFACEPVPGDCDLFLDHVRNNICNGNEEHYDYLLNWMARAVQQPDSPGEVAVVLRGGRGTGKSLFARQFGSLFGSHFLQVSDPKHLVGNFNAHLRDTIALFADEAFFAGDKKHESILKMLVTEPTLVIEAKGIDAETARNYTHLIMASNEQWVIPAGEDERRFFMLDVGSRRAQDTVYFKALVDQMNNGGREALLYLLLHRDLSSFEVRKVPQTRALREQKQITQEPYKAVMLEMLQTGVTPDPDFLKDYPNWVSVEGIVDAIKDRGEFPRHTHGLHTRIGLYLKPFVMLDAQGRPDTSRIKRHCIMQGGRPVSGDYIEGAITTDVRRTMYKLKPLAELRELHRHLVDSWPASPTKWTDEPRPSDHELARQYEQAHGVEIGEFDLLGHRSTPR
jgi:hypothetical protein